MKPRTSLLLLSILILIALGGIYYVFTSLSNQEPAQVFPATVNRDCAPWDGAAFTVAVRHGSGNVIYITIWQAPDIKFPTTFPMPDDAEAEQDGHAYILPELGPFTPLHGEVSFQGLSVGEPVGGRFRLTSAGGEVFEGRFIAEWGDQVVYCG